MLKIKPVYICLLSGLLLVLAWPPLPTAFLLFVALVPLFMLHKQLSGTKRQHLKFWGCAYLALLVFNIGTTWWVWNASPSGSVMMLVLNSLLMSLPFLGFSFASRLFPKISYLIFVLFYLGFEYWHFSWSASWPWMTLGKGFASMPWYIQWYEFTGELGGTALILTVNVWVSKLVIERKAKRLWQPALCLLAFYLLSVIVSLQYSPIHKGGGAVECVISQPNIDPYTEKFGNGDNYMYPEIQLDYALEVAEPFIKPSTDVILMPETAIVGANDESDLNHSELMKPLLKLTAKNHICVIAGSETYAMFKSRERPTVTARYDSFSTSWYDSYNTALLIDSNGVSNVYHKSRLVPGVEKMPFEFLEKLSINLGGTSGSLGTSKEPINFTIPGGVKIAPMICYESIFGDYANEFVRNGANILAVITNDGWWGETPGYRQHLWYGAIRCIETRRDMIRSANTGVSAKIDRMGRIEQTIGYKKRGAFACTAFPYHNITFYVQYGNLTGKLSAVLSIMILLAMLVRLFTRKKSVTN